MAVLDLEQVRRHRITGNRLDEVALGAEEAGRRRLAIHLDKSGSGKARQRERGQTRGIVGRDGLTLTKWSNRLTWAMVAPFAILRPYSAFLIEWTDTESVIVSTRPDESPVMRIRKLRAQIEG